MCMSTPKMDTTILDKLTPTTGGTSLSTQKVANGTKEKVTPKRTMSSLRVPLKKTTDTTNTGVNTTDTTTGLNIPV